MRQINAWGQMKWKCSKYFAQAACAMWQLWWTSWYQREFIFINSHKTGFLPDATCLKKMAIQCHNEQFQTESKKPWEWKISCKTNLKKKYIHNITLNKILSITIQKIYMYIHTLRYVCIKTEQNCIYIYPAFALLGHGSTIQCKAGMQGAGGHEVHTKIPPLHCKL